MVVEQLIKALKHLEPVGRSLAARALGKLRDERAINPLIEALMDEDSKALEEVTLALLQSGNEKLVSEGESLLSTMRCMWTVRKDVAYALGEIGDKRAVEPLIQALKNENPEFTEKLKLINNEAIQTDRMILRMGNQLIRREAAIALGKIGDKRAVEPLIQALKRPEYIDNEFMDPKMKKTKVILFDTFEKKQR
jgi:HEAT repeat protein